jgi:hypothetical protein
VLVSKKMANGWREQYYRYKDLFLNIVDLYKNRKDIRAFLELILSISTVTIFVVFAIRPTMLTIVSLYNQIKDKKVTLSLLNQKISDLQTANAVFNQNKDFIADINSAIFGGPKPDTITKQFLGLAAKDNVTVLGITVGRMTIIGKNITIKETSDIKPLPEKAQSMPISISLKGDYPNIMSFIKDAENLRIPIKIDSITITSSQNQTENTIVSIITARVPYIGQK